MPLLLASPPGLACNLPSISTFVQAALMEADTGMADKGFSNAFLGLVQPGYSQLRTPGGWSNSASF